jgi:FkbM family methyltransferase
VTTDLITIELPEGSKFTFPRNLDNCVMGVFDGEYAYPKLPDEPEVRTVLDIGANVGAFAVWACRRWPRARLNCYEPHPFARGLLEKNTAHLPVTIDGHAISTFGGVHGGSVDLFEGADNGQEGCNLGLTTIYDNLLTHVVGKVANVPALHPADLPSADILKIDAEGVEWEILKNYPHLDDTWLVLLEFHRAEDIRPIESIMDLAGFRQFRREQLIDCVGRMMFTRSRATYNRKLGVYE